MEISTSCNKETVRGTKAADEIEVTGLENLIEGQAGNDKISAYGQKNNIFGGAGADYISVSGYSVPPDYTYLSGSENLIDAGAGNDGIEVLGSKNTLKGGAGNDIIYVSGDENKIYGDAGTNWIIERSGKNNEIFGGKDRDCIIAAGDGTKITTGAGKDYINLALQEEGTAHFTITDLSNNDSLVILNQGVTKWEDNYILRADLNSNNDIVLTASSGGKTLVITLENVKDLAQIEKVSIISDGDIDLAKRVFKPYKKCTYNLVSMINAGTVPPPGASLVGKTLTIGKKFKPASVDLAAYSELSATGIDAAAATKKLTLVGTGEADTLVGGKGNDTIQGGAGADSIGGGAGHDYITSSGKSATIQGGTGNDTIRASGESGIQVFGDAGNDTLQVSSSDSTVEGGAGNDVMWVDGAGNSIDGGAGNDYIGVTGKAAITAGAGNDTVMVNSSELIIEDLCAKDTLVFIKGTDADASWGKKVTSFRADVDAEKKTLTLTSKGPDDVTITLADMTDTSKIDNVWVVLDGTTKDGKLKKIKSRFRLSSLLTGGNIVSNSTLDGDTLALTAKYAKTSFSLADFKAKGGTAENLDARASGRKLALTGSADANVIYASKGGGTLRGGLGDDTLHGNKGNDIFAYKTGDGDDVIHGYTAGKDSLKVSGGITSYTVSGSDVKLAMGEGSITLKDAAEKQISFLNDKNKVGSKVMYLATGVAVETVGKASKTIIGDSYAGGSFVHTDYKKAAAAIDASARKASLDITGNAKGNTIYAAESGTVDGGKGNDVIHAGAGGGLFVGGLGNDKLYFGDGVDVFSYRKGDGKDTIFNFEGGKDKIAITDLSVGDVKVTAGGDVILSAGGGSITLKGAKGKDIFIADATHGGGVTYNFTASCKQANLSSAAVKGGTV